MALAAGAHYGCICIMQTDCSWLQMVSGGEQSRLRQSKKRPKPQETKSYQSSILMKPWTDQVGFRSSCALPHKGKQQLDFAGNRPKSSKSSQVPFSLTLRYKHHFTRMPLSIRGTQYRLAYRWFQKLPWMPHFCSLKARLALACLEGLGELCFFLPLMTRLSSALATFPKDCTSGEQVFSAWCESRKASLKNTV